MSGRLVDPSTLVIARVTHTNGGSEHHPDDCPGGQDWPCNRMGARFAERAAVLEDEFTIRHCTEWCQSAGVDLAHVPAMVAELADDGPESTLSWRTVARAVGARYETGEVYQ